MKALQIPILIGTLVLCQSLAASALNVRALALAKEPKLPERFVKVDDGYVALSFSVIRPSEVVRSLTAEGVLPLYEPMERPDGGIAYKMVEKIKLPAGAKGVLLLGWDNGEAPQYLAIDDDYLSAKYNDWLLVNTAPKQVAFQIGQDQKPIVINSSSIANHRINKGEGVGVAVVGKAKWGEKIKTFYSTYWPIRAGERGIVIFFYRQGDRIAVRRITDVLKKPEAAAEE